MAAILPHRAGAGQAHRRIRRRRRMAGTGVPPRCPQLTAIQIAAAVVRGAADLPTPAALPAPRRGGVA